MIPERWENIRFDLIEISKGAALRRFKQSIKDEWGCCAYCGLHVEGDDCRSRLTIDHVRPKAHGGESLRTNLVPACLSCNSSKGSNRDWEAWYVEQSFFCTDRCDRIKAWIKPLKHDLWCLSGATNDEYKPHRRANLSIAQDCDGSEDSIKGRACRRITKLLGGEVQAEASLSCC